jgi:hypothetical protein
MEIKLCQSFVNSHGGFHKTKQNKTKQNKTKQNKTKQNKTKQNKTKQSKTKHLIYRHTTNFFLQFSASDNPHGRFRIASNTQRITVENDLSRVLRFTIQRIEGKFGDVRVNYQLVYSRNYPGSLNGFVVIRNEESDVSFGRDIFSRLYSKRHRPANARQL